VVVQSGKALVFLSSHAKALPKNLIARLSRAGSQGEQGFGGLLMLILCAQKLALGNSVVATGEGEERSRAHRPSGRPRRASPRPGEASERARACGSPSSSYRLHKW